MALIADLMNIHIWQYSGGKSARPASILEQLNTVKDDTGYDTPEEFEEALKQIREGAV